MGSSEKLKSIKEGFKAFEKNIKKNKPNSFGIESFIKSMDELLTLYNQSEDQSEKEAIQVLRLTYLRFIFTHLHDITDTVTISKLNYFITKKVTDNEKKIVLNVDSGANQVLSDFKEIDESMSHDTYRANLNKLKKENPEKYDFLVSGDLSSMSKEEALRRLKLIVGLSKKR